ncbi:uncharacterized protein LOC134271378 [Saccostrea cucullata]|uniref:uncharacterized protein LOC134271378 n=1 Tax=Saccostrea cuccullata TaxID=36930 RepID=UPI002ED3835D
MISEEINKGQTQFEQILTAVSETRKKVDEKCEHHENSQHKAKPIENSMSIKFKKAVEETRNVQRRVVDLMENIRNDTTSINTKTKEVEKEVEKITSLIMELSEFIEAFDENVQMTTLRKDIDRTEKGNHIPLQKKTERENIQFELLYIVLTLLFLVSCLNVIVLLCLFNKFVKRTAVLEHGPEETKTSVMQQIQIMLRSLKILSAS